MSKVAVTLVLLTLIVVGAYFFYTAPADAPTVPVDTGEIYTNTKHGISFTYPNTYVLEEREVGNGERWHDNVTLMDREAAVNIPQNGEGPPTITIDFFQNNLDTQTA